MDSPSIRPARQWLAAISGSDPAARRALESLYGPGHPAAETARKRLVDLLGGYLTRYGDEPVVLTRAPGRVNTMGRHVDHQGGHVNPVAIDRDVWVVAGARTDRRVLLHNVRTDCYPEREFCIDELLAGYGGGEWLAFLDTAEQQALAQQRRGDWAQYVRAPMARLQAAFPERRLCGMNVAAGGDIPPASGLSSSSAVVVSTMEAVAALNGVAVPPERFVELCGEAEWYVGTRGGAGDHAAMKLAQRGRLVQIGFFPFGALGTVPFPAGHVLVVCNSRQEARKTVGVRDTFNHRVACYNLGRELLKRAHPQLAPAIVHLRDANADALGVTPAAIVRMVAGLPEGICREQLREMLPAETCDRWFGTHAETAGAYPIRSVVLYGLAECERSRRCAELLHAGDVDGFGRWMRISHDGDRVSGGVYPLSYADGRMAALLAKAEAGCVDLALEPGTYACSTQRIDHMVDLALSVDGVVGAQMAGAGLGGCIMALAHEDAVGRLRDAMESGYYDPLQLEPDIVAVTAVAGSGALCLA